MKSDEPDFLPDLLMLLTEAKARATSPQNMEQSLLALQELRSTACVAANRFRPTAFDFLRFPISYFLFVLAKSKLAQADLPDRRYHYWTEKLIRNAGHMQFGVKVNFRWYLRLLQLVARNSCDHQELRSWLGAMTVTWTRDGELKIRQHHWFTKAAVIGFVGFLIVLGIYDYALIASFTISIRAKIALGIMVGLAFVYLFWCNWYVGPFSWRAVARLNSVRLHHQTRP